MRKKNMKPKSILRQLTLANINTVVFEIVQSVEIMNSSQTGPQKKARVIALLQDRINAIADEDNPDEQHYKLILEVMLRQSVPNLIDLIISINNGELVVSDKIRRCCFQ